MRPLVAALALVALLLLVGMPSPSRAADRAPGDVQLAAQALPGAAATPGPNLRERLLRGERLPGPGAASAAAPVPLGFVREAPAASPPGPLARWRLAHATTSSIP